MLHYPPAYASKDCINPFSIAMLQELLIHHKLNFLVPLLIATSILLPFLSARKSELHTSRCLISLNSVIQITWITLSFLVFLLFFSKFISKKSYASWPEHFVSVYKSHQNSFKNPPGFLVCNTGICHFMCILKH